MIKKVATLGVFLFLILCLACLLFASTPEKSFQEAFQIASSKDSQSSTKVSQENEPEIPEWVRRTNFAIEVGTGQRPKYFMETIQPLFGTQEKDVVFFNQSRISGRSARPTYNFGLGLRGIFEESWLLGTNVFYDYQDLHKHSRAGIGFEAIGDRGFEARVNTYLRISNQRLVREDSANEYYEKVANGFDWELGGPLPYMPYLKLYGGGNWYNFEHFKNKYGWQARLEFAPIKYSRIDFIMLNDTKRKKMGYRFEGALTLAFTSFSLRDIIEDLKCAKAAYPKLNLRGKVLDRIVRDFDITLITSTKSKATGLTVEGGRSN